MLAHAPTPIHPHQTLCIIEHNDDEVARLIERAQDDKLIRQNRRSDISVGDRHVINIGGSDTNLEQFEEWTIRMAYRLSAR